MFPVLAWCTTIGFKKRTIETAHRIETAIEDYLRNGLNDPTVVDQTGWGGFFRWDISPDKETYCYTNHRQDTKKISQKYESYFYPAIFANFAARMDWAKQTDL